MSIGIQSDITLTTQTYHTVKQPHTFLLPEHAEALGGPTTPGHYWSVLKSLNQIRSV